MNPILLRLRRKQQRHNWKLLQAVKRSIQAARIASLSHLTGKAPKSGLQTPKVTLHLQSNGAMDFPIYTHTPPGGVKDDPTQRSAIGSAGIGAKDPPSNSPPKGEDGTFQEIHESGPITDALPRETAETETAQQLNIYGYTTETRSRATKSAASGYVSDSLTQTLPTTQKPETGNQAGAVNDVTDINIGLFTDPLHEPPALV